MPDNKQVESVETGTSRQLTIETEQEVDGRWIADIISEPGVTVYGGTEKEAIVKAINLWAEIKLSCPPTPVTITSGMRGKNKNGC